MRSTASRVSGRFGPLGLGLLALLLLAVRPAAPAAAGSLYGTHMFGLGFGMVIFDNETGTALAGLLKGNVHEHVDLMLDASQLNVGREYGRDLEATTMLGSVILFHHAGRLTPYLAGHYGTADSGPSGSDEVTVFGGTMGLEFPLSATALGDVHVGMLSPENENDAFVFGLDIEFPLAEKLMGTVGFAYGAYDRSRDSATVIAGLLLGDF